MFYQTRPGPMTEGWCAEGTSWRWSFPPAPSQLVGNRDLTYLSLDLDARFVMSPKAASLLLPAASPGFSVGGLPAGVRMVPLVQCGTALGLPVLGRCARACRECIAARLLNAERWCVPLRQLCVGGLHVGCEWARPLTGILAAALEAARRWLGRPLLRAASFAKSFTGCD